MASGGKVDTALDIQRSGKGTCQRKSKSNLGIKIDETEV
jgi:hypothetical protein